VPLDANADSWELPVAGFAVTDIWFSGQVYVTAYRRGDATKGSLSVGPHPRYENWELTGPDGLYLVAPPGAGDPRINS